jgi:hypothetical protein
MSREEIMSRLRRLLDKLLVHPITDMDDRDSYFAHLHKHSPNLTDDEKEVIWQAYQNWLKTGLTPLKRSSAEGENRL